MNHITDFFIKTLKLISNKDEEDIIVRSVVNEYLKFDIEKESFKIVADIIYIKENAIIRSEINLKKKEILDTINQQLKSKRFIDIR